MEWRARICTRPGSTRIGPDVRSGSRLCENSGVELTRRKFVSITLNKQRTLWQSPPKEEKRENNSAHSLLVSVFTPPGSIASVWRCPSHFRFTPHSRRSLLDRQVRKAPNPEVNDHGPCTNARQLS